VVLRLNPVSNPRLNLRLSPRVVLRLNPVSNRRLRKIRSHNTINSSSPGVAPPIS